LFDGVIMGPIKLIFGLIIGTILFIVLAQILLVLFTYSAERLYLNKYAGVIQKEMEENNGLSNYDIPNGESIDSDNAFAYDNTKHTFSSASTPLGSGKSIKQLSSEFIKGNITENDGTGTQIRNEDSNNGVVGNPLYFSEIPGKTIPASFKTSGFNEADGNPPLISKSVYSFEVDISTVQYVGSTVTVTLHRDLGFNLLWNIPWVIKMQESATYTYDMKYTPSDGISRETGEFFIPSLSS